MDQYGSSSSLNLILVFNNTSSDSFDQILSQTQWSFFLFHFLAWVLNSHQELNMKGHMIHLTSFYFWVFRFDNRFIINTSLCIICRDLSIQSEAFDRIIIFVEFCRACFKLFAWLFVVQKYIVILDCQSFKILLDL